MTPKTGRGDAWECVADAYAKHCMDAIPVSLMIHGLDGHLLYANRQACQNLGYTKDELLGLHIPDIDPAVSTEGLSIFAGKIRDRGSITFESTHRRKDGSTFPVEISATFIARDGRSLIVTLAQDITKRKETHDALQLAQFAYRKSCIATFRSKPGGRIIDANEKACEELGYTLEELCRLNLSDINPTVTDQSLEQLWQNLCVEQMVIIETVHRRKDGTRFPVEITANLLEYGDNKLSVSYVRDISERQAAARQKAQMQAQLRKALRMEALGTLAGGIAHDIKNIMMAIGGYSDLARLKCNDPAAVRRYLAEINTAIERANQLVHQIQDFSRQNQSTKQSLDITRVFMETVRMIKATFPGNIRVIHDCHPDPAVVYADETRIHQVIMNLCANARHAMSAQVGTLTVTLAPVTIRAKDEACSFDLGPGKYAKIAVTDTGGGMEPDILERAFDPYFTTRDAHEGAGMGLAIVHGIVKDHGGAIKVSTEPGKGTTFTTFLPYADFLPEASDVAPESDGLPTGRESVLLVDDQQAILDMVKALLEGLGYGVETRQDALEALEIFQKDPLRFDLVMTDYYMPRMKGDHLAREMKKIRPDISIILFSGFSGEIGTMDLTRSGITKMLSKPLTLTELAKTVRNILDGKANENENV